VVHIIPPFSSHRPTETVSAPKVYGFDTGFVCYYRGWSELRQEDMGLLWEHLVLNEIVAHLQSRETDTGETNGAMRSILRLHGLGSF
jgi:uncharacterized protein